MTELDQISVMLGELKASSETSHNQRVELFKQNGEIKELLGELKPLVAVVGEHETEIKSLVALKNRTLGYATAIAAGVGGATSYVAKVMQVTGKN